MIVTHLEHFFSGFHISQTNMITIPMQLFNLCEIHCHEQIIPKKLWTRDFLLDFVGLGGGGRILKKQTQDKEVSIKN